MKRLKIIAVCLCLSVNSFCMSKDLKVDKTQDLIGAGILGSLAGISFYVGSTYMIGYIAPIFFTYKAGKYLIHSVFSEERQEDIE